MPSVKPDIWCASQNSDLNSSGLFPDYVCLAEDEIARAEAECCASQPS